MSAILRTDVVVYQNMAKQQFDFSVSVKEYVPADEASLAGTWMIRVMIKFPIDMNYVDEFNGWQEGIAQILVDKARKVLPTYDFTKKEIETVCSQLTAVITKASVKQFSNFLTHKPTKPVGEYQDLKDYYEKYKQKYKSYGVVGSGVSGIRSLANKLPGADSLVTPPCSCFMPEEKPTISVQLRTVPLTNAVIHLNDMHRWTREKIADWMDELHDKGEINIEFDVETISDEEIEELVSSEGGEK